MEDQFDIIFGEDVSFARAILRDAEEAGALQKIQQMTHEAIKSGKVEKEGQLPALHLYADGEGGVEAGERDIRFVELEGVVGGDAEGGAGGDAEGDAEGDAQGDVGGDAGGDVQGDAQGDAEGDAGGDAGGGAGGAGGGADEADGEGAAAAAADLEEAAAEAAAEADVDAGGHLAAAFASAVPITADIAFNAIVADMRAYLRAMHAYLVRRISTSYAAFPLRIASYWHPTKGTRYLKEDFDKYMTMKQNDMSAYLVGRCRLTVPKHELKARLVSALETKM
jgi:hypothetical protein